MKFYDKIQDGIFSIDGKILEGGCGIGGYGYCLQRKGYDVYRVDSDEKTIEKVKEIFPNLNVYGHMC